MVLHPYGKAHHLFRDRHLLAVWRIHADVGHNSGSVHASRQAGQPGVRAYNFSKRTTLVPCIARTRATKSPGGSDSACTWMPCDVNW